MPPPPTTHDLILRGKSHFAHANRNRRTPKDLVLAALTDDVLALTHRALHRDIFLSQSLAFLHALSADPPRPPRKPTPDSQPTSGPTRSPATTRARSARRCSRTSTPPPPASRGTKAKMRGSAR